MIHVSNELEVNKDLHEGEPRLNRSQVWKGLVMKAENALPFVPGMAHCEVVARTDNGLVRDIVFRGEAARERVTFRPEEKVTFLRLSGNADGVIVNEILGDYLNPRLRFSFALQLVDSASNSDAEHELRTVMERDYSRAVDATIMAIRRMALDESAKAR